VVPAAFSILERIVVVETPRETDTSTLAELAFSILERIVVVETGHDDFVGGVLQFLSVSSNGSWWLKLARLERRYSLTSSLSVSSNGSWWLKLDSPEHRVAVFIDLSVSSNGSWWLKRTYVRA